MKLRLENKRGSILRINAGIWIPKLQIFANSVVIFDTGAHKTIIDEDLATILEIPISLKGGVSTVTATGISATHSSVLPKILLGKMPISKCPRLKKSIRRFRQSRNPAKQQLLLA